MTILDDGPGVDLDERELRDLDADAPLTVPDAADGANGAARQPSPPAPPPAGDGDEEEGPPPLSVLWRPVLAATLTTTALGLVAGGIFGSWGARLTGLVAALLGGGYALVAMRSHRSNAVQAAFPVVAVVAAAASLIVRGAAPGEVFSLMGDAVESGRLFSPPVPYDPGWTPLLLLIVSVIGFASAWVAAALGRGRLGVAIPLPIVGLAAISQPDDGEFIAGLCAFLPVLAALAVLFRGGARTDDLGGEFELKRALRSVLLAIPLVIALVVLSSTSLLFPEPVYDPTEQPQKPKPVPLSAATDRVLFEIDGPDDLTGPWRTGVLDVYDAGAWKLPPFSRARLEDVANGGSLSDVRTDVSQLEVTFTTRDLGDSAVLPQVAGATTFLGEGSGLGYDPRTQLIRAREGRAPKDFTYTLTYPAYPGEDELRSAGASDADDFADQLDVPKPPPVVRDLLASAPDVPWERLDLLRQTLLANVTAKGAGSPADVTVDRAAELFEPNAKATPFEIVATEALLARWAGVPSRVGFGFDGLNDEDGVLTVRPRNSAQWLEVHFPEFGWVPLIGAPKQAEASLDDDLSRFDPEVIAGDDVAVELFLPFRHDELGQLHERIRDELVYWSPVLALLALAWIGWPLPAKAWRRAKRRRWAAGVGPAAQIAVEYVEFRDVATDLNVGDIYTTPLEFLYAVRDDAEHEHFAWLHTRSLYGDLRTATEADVAAAESMGMSLRRRLRRGQPALAQVGSLISRASLHQPYSTEVPNIRIPRLPALPRLRLGRRLRKRPGAPRLRLRRAT